MTTPLFWKSWEISNSVYQTLLRYPFPASMNLKTQQFVVDTRTTKLVPFYISVSNLTTFFILYAALVIRALTSHTIHTKIYLLIVNIFETCLIGLCLSLIGVMLPCINDFLKNYYNMLLKFEKRLKGVNSTTVFQLPSLKNMLQSELEKFLRGKPLDMAGIQAFFLTVVLILIGIVLAVAGTLSGLDYTSQIVNEYCEQGCSPGYKYSALLIGFMSTQWCTLEATRVYMSILVPSMTICHIIFCIISNITKKELSIKTLLLYHELYCTHQIVVPHVRIAAGVLMGFGLSLYVFGNWMLLSLWTLVPVEIYLIDVGVIFVAYCVLFQTLPLLIKVNEVSLELIQKWKNDANIDFRRRSYWRKELVAQQAVAFYYATTKFEKDTQVNYYSNIVDNTLTVLMLY